MTTGRARIVLVTGLGLLLSAGCARPLPAPAAGATAPPLETRLEARGTGGAVSSAEPEATAVGVSILRAGGNAADAGVAVALALAVDHPQAGNLGGGGFALVRTADTIAALDFRETAPAAATRDMYLGADGRPRENATWIGPLAAGVPGSPAGLHELHRRFGRLPWRRVVEPAIALARHGFAVTPRLHEAVGYEREVLSAFPESAAIWLPGGAPIASGTIVRLPDLAATLTAYADRGPGAMTGGPIAAAIESASRARGGILAAADLAAYRPVWREPLRFQMFGWNAAGMPLPSSGGAIVAESAALLARLGWERLPRGGDERAHLLAEIWRRAYADRFVLGDPTTTEVTSLQILDPAWIETRAATFRPDAVTPSLQVIPWPGTGGPPIAVPAAEAGETTHLSVVDAEGTMVSLTTTLNGWFGCGLTVPGAGFLLNNEMDDFTTAPGAPNSYGLLQGEANAVRPGKRMLSSMAPTIAWKGREAIALGSPGGSRIPTATLQVFLNLLDGDPPGTAVTRPRLHHQWLPDQIVVEKEALSPEARAALERRGHAIKEATWHIGEVSLVVRHADGRVEAAADPRGPGGAGVERAVP